MTDKFDERARELVKKIHHTNDESLDMPGYKYHIELVAQALREAAALPSAPHAKDRIDMARKACAEWYSDIVESTEAERIAYQSGYCHALSRLAAAPSKAVWPPMDKEFYDACNNAWSAVPTQDNEGYVPEKGAFKTGWHSCYYWLRERLSAEGESK